MLVDACENIQSSIVVKLFEETWLMPFEKTFVWNYCYWMK